MTLEKQKMLQQLLTDNEFNSYLETVLWAETDRDEPLDKKYDIDDFDPFVLEFLRKMINQFIDENRDDIDTLLKLNNSEWPRASSMKSILHDFYLTSQGCGAGFWDGDYPEPQASRLTEASKKYEFVCFYIGDDGKIYVSFPLKLGKELGVPGYGICRY